MRRILSTALVLGLAGLLHAADPAPAATPAAAPSSSPAPAPSAPASAPAAPAVKPDSAKPRGVSGPTGEAGGKPAAPAKKLSKKARAAADSAAKADSLKAAAAADSLKAAQAKAAADSAARAAAVADSLRADSARQADARAKAAADSARMAAAADSAAADSATAKSKKRKRIVRETTVNTIDELKGRYRSPKKALFMSLIVPGLGQAYVGHSWFNYTRGAVYLLTDVALAYGWHYYVGVRQDEEIKKYKAFADSNWRQYKYEDSVLTYKSQTKLNPRREGYCEAVQSRGSAKGQQLFSGCLDPDKSSEYPSFKNEYNDKDLSADSVGHLRAGFANSQQFYELIGKENEFITGWLDAPAMKMGDSAWYAVDESGNVLTKNGFSVLATTASQRKYIDMRAQANDYARMQAWFLGGMVVNHIVSAVDAALTARYHNKALYQTETSWYDRLHLESRLAWDGFSPVPNVTASLTF